MKFKKEFVKEMNKGIMPMFSSALRLIGSNEIKRKIFIN